jgi:DNA polymerase I
VDEWLWGWDPTPGIVSVWAEPSGHATVWRRIGGELRVEHARFRPWAVVDRPDDVRRPGIGVRELAGEGEQRWLVDADDFKRLAHVRDRPTSLVLSAEEQYLVRSGRTYFRGLTFDDLRRLQFDLETTGLDPAHDAIFLIAVRTPDGKTETLEGDEADIVRRLVATVRAHDPDVIENHNLHGFDLPFLVERARVLGVPLALGRTGEAGLRQRGARRGAQSGDGEQRIRYIAPGRELIDTLDAVVRHDFATRDLPGHGLKAVARHLGLAAADREEIPGDQIAAVYARDPERVRRYARADVDEVAGLARLLGGPAFALAQMAPRRYERLADAGPATGVIDPLLVRAYLRAGAALPLHRPGSGEEHAGAALHLFAAGVAHRIVKADVASLYPSLMRTFRISPARDRLGALLALVDRLVDQRLAAKAAGKAAPAGSAERHQHEAMSAAMKLVINSAYGYLAAGSLTRFSDVDAANEVTRRGRDVLHLMCRELAARGVTLLEADTDGVYVAVPETWTPDDERRVVGEVAALLPAGVQLELDGRYAAMLSHEPKNYALLGYDGALVLRGVAFRSSRAEPFGAAFLRAAVARLLVGDVPGVRAAYLASIAALRRRELSTHDVATLVRLTRTPAEYGDQREQRRELAYEALLAEGRTWHVGERVRVYRTVGGGAALARDGVRDYDVEHYERLLRTQFAARLVRAFEPDHYAAVFADPDQLTLFTIPLDTIRPILTTYR